MTRKIVHGFPKNHVIEQLIHKGTIALPPELDDRIKERIKLWSQGKNQVEWPCVLTGQMRASKDLILFEVTDFYEIPSYNANRQHGLLICLDDVLRVADKNFVVALLHTHPSGNLLPSVSDLATFLAVDNLLGRPLLYIIASPDGKKLILSFERCRDCEHSPFKLLAKQNARKQKGGEKRNWGAFT